MNWGWISIRTERRGGTRPGAGRKPLDAKRINRSIKAFDDEWELINRFAKLVKHGERDECEKFLLKMKDKFAR
ncbi:MAG: hypothetical protein ACRDBM_05925 [Sporomusa sp.]